MPICGWHAAATAGLVAIALGCTVDDIDYTGKGCSFEAPCPDGLSCVAGRCMKAAEPQTCTPAFTAEQFKRAWETPHTIRWTWTPNGVPADFVQYKLVLGTSEQTLEAARQMALAGENDGPGGSVWTQADNPELGQYELRLSGGTDLIVATTTDGLTPGTEYSARLLVYDASGCVHTTDRAIGLTAKESSLGYVLFDDQGHPKGYARPPQASVQTDPAQAFEGDRFILWPGWPDDGSVADGSWENVGIASIGTDPAQHYPLLDFSAAYLQLAVAIDGASVAAWGQVRFLFGPSPGVCGDSSLGLVNGYVFRPGGGYHLIELPLNQFVFGGKSLEAATVKERSVCEVSIGRGWAIGDSVRIDEIRLRW
jgi:hypothetical protein